MKLNNTHIKYWKLYGFLMLLALMVVLNNQFDSSDTITNTTNSASISYCTNDLGITPVATQIPTTTEGSIPIKLIINPNSNLFILAQQGFSFRDNNKFKLLEQRFLIYGTGINLNFLKILMLTSRNKDIR